MEWFSAALASANAAKDISQSLFTLRDEEMIRSRVFDLTQSLMELQQQMMAANIEQMALHSRIRELESNLVQATAKADDRERYRLHSLSTGSLVYALKPEHADESTPHYLCTNCFEQGNRVTLQVFYGAYETIYKCPRCSSSVSVEQEDILQR